MLSKDKMYGPGGSATQLYSSAPSHAGGVTQAPMKLGSMLMGDCRAEFVLCQLVLAAVTTLIPGAVYLYDKDFNATLLTTADAVQGGSVGVAAVNQVNVAAGTYYLFLQTNGNAPMACTTGSVAAALCETTATAGVVNFTNAPTAGSHKVSVASLYQASVAITATTTTGSATLTALAAAAPNSLDDVSPGAVVSGAGIPANTTILTVNGAGSARTITMSANATASATGEAVTVNGVLNANLVRPTIGTSN